MFVDLYSNITKPFKSFYIFIHSYLKQPLLWSHFSQGNHDPKLQSTLSTFFFFWGGGAFPKDFFLHLPCKNLTPPPNHHDLHYFRMLEPHNFSFSVLMVFENIWKDFLFLFIQNLSPTVAQPTPWNHDLNLNLHYLRMCPHNLSFSDLMVFGNKICKDFFISILIQNLTPPTLNLHNPRMLLHKFEHFLSDSFWEDIF